MTGDLKEIKSFGPGDTKAEKEEKERKREGKKERREEREKGRNREGAYEQARGVY